MSPFSSSHNLPLAWIVVPLASAGWKELQHSATILSGKLTPSDATQLKIINAWNSAQAIFISKATEISQSKYVKSITDTTISVANTTLIFSGKAKKKLTEIAAYIVTKKVSAKNAVISSVPYNALKANLLFCAWCVNKVWIGVKLVLNAIWRATCFVAKFLPRVSFDRDGLTGRVSVNIAPWIKPKPVSRKLKKRGNLTKISDVELLSLCRKARKKDPNSFAWIKKKKHIQAFLPIVKRYVRRLPDGYFAVPTKLAKKIDREFQGRTLQKFSSYITAYKTLFNSSSLPTPNNNTIKTMIIHVCQEYIDDKKSYLP